MFAELSRYIPDFQRADFSSLDGFIKTVYEIEEEHPELELNNYQEVLENNGLEWSADSLMNADLSDKDAQCLLAMILSIIRADRFNEGVLREFLDRDYITSWLIELDKRASSS